MFLHRLGMKRRHYLDHHSLLAPLKRDKASPSGITPTFNPAPHVLCFLCVQSGRKHKPGGG